MSFSNITDFIGRIRFLGWLLIFSVGAFTLLCAMFLTLMIVYPKWEQEEKRIKHAKTYPWSFQINNLSGQKIELLDFDGFGNRDSPSRAPFGVGKDGRGGDVYHRVSNLPTKITFLWHMPGDTEERRQDFDFPQIPPGSDGEFVMELHPDQKWTLEFVPTQSSVAPVLPGN